LKRNLLLYTILPLANASERYSALKRLSLFHLLFLRTIFIIQAKHIGFMQAGLDKLNFSQLLSLTFTLGWTNNAEH
jgi:hypothetical protein